MEQRLAGDLREFVELLNAHDVRYLLVGGFAVAYHGVARLTDDIDFWIEPSSDNADRVLKVLDAFGFGSLGLEQSDFIAPDQVVQLGYPPNRIDLMTRILGVSFDEAWNA